MRAAKMLLVLGAAAGVTGATAAAAGAAGTGASTAAHAARLQASRLGPVGPAAADRAAISYISAHHRGPGAARVLATEPDTDRSQAVYDVRVLAPDRITYVVHVSRASGAVLWADKAEGQAASRAAGAPERRSGHEEDGAGGHPEGDHRPAGPTGDS